MKQELPIACLLLAIGALLWFVTFPAATDEPSSPDSLATTTESITTDSLQPSDAAAVSGQPEPTPGTFTSNPRPSNFQQPPEAATPTQVRDAPTQQPRPLQQQDWVSQQQRSASSSPDNHPLRQLPLESPSSADSAGQGTAQLDQRRSSAFADIPSEAAGSYWHPTSDIRTIDFLTRVAKQTANSPPIGAGLKLRAKLFGQQISATGRYFQRGQSRHQSRLELMFGEGSDGPTIFQMCDGRFVYRLETIHGRQTFNFVDLKRIQDQAGESASSFSPTGWVATGELSSMLQHVGSAFSFGSPQNDDAQGNLTIRGAWSPRALRQVLANSAEVLEDSSVDASTESTAPLAGVSNQIRWEKIPPQLPHGVELTFANDEIVGYFPKRIVFVKFERADSNQTTLANPVVVVEFTKPQRIPDINDRMFVIDTQNVESTDVTEHYLARVKEFDARRFAESQKKQGALER